MSMFSVPPYLYLDKGDENAYGITADIMNVLASHHNFQYHKLVSDQWWVIYQNGSVGGALGLVSVKKCSTKKFRTSANYVVKTSALLISLRTEIHVNYVHQKIIFF